MSLFKILKGDSSRISQNVTPFHDGWCYYTSDDGGFYIDSAENNGTQKRTRINPTAYVKTFLASEWRNGVITIPETEHQQKLTGNTVLADVYMLTGDQYSNQCLAAMDTTVSVTDDKSVVLSYDGTGYAGKVILRG